MRQALVKKLASKFITSYVYGIYYFHKDKLYFSLEVKYSPNLNLTPLRKGEI